MKQKEIISFIKRRFKKTAKYFTAIINDFEIEAIHQFRTEIKKLRAFLRLLNVDPKKELKISKNIKEFYNCIGDIRNLQLQIKNINEISGSIEDPMIVSYLKQIDADIEVYKIDPAKYINATSFLHQEQKIIGRLHGNLKKGLIKKFIFQKLNELQELLFRMHEDESLHSIRKVLKDILYNWFLIKRYCKLLPSAIAEKKSIESLTEILGDYCDRRTSVELLETYYNNLPQHNENNVLQKIIEKWQAEKLNLKQQIFYYLRLIQKT